MVAIQTIFKCLGQDFVCILRHCMHRLQMNPQNGYRVLITVEHFFFMLIKLKCTGYRVIIYNCLGTGAALSFHVKLSLFSLQFFFKLTKKNKITYRKLSQLLNNIGSRFLSIQNVTFIQQNNFFLHEYSVAVYHILCIFWGICRSFNHLKAFKVIVTEQKHQEQQERLQARLKAMSVMSRYSTRLGLPPSCPPSRKGKKVMAGVKW